MIDRDFLREKLIGYYALLQNNKVDEFIDDLTSLIDNMYQETFNEVMKLSDVLDFILFHEEDQDE